MCLPMEEMLKEMWVWSLGWEDSLEEGMATHSSIFAWRIPQTEEPGGLQSTGLKRVRHGWSNWTRTHRHASIWYTDSLSHPYCCPHLLAGKCGNHTYYLYTVADPCCQLPSCLHRTSGKCCPLTLSNEIISGELIRCPAFPSWQLLHLNSLW